MSVNRTVLLVTTGLLLFVAVFIFAFDNEEKEYATTSNAEIEILQTWRLPTLLKEISGIAYIGNQKMAAVQDERGSIFIFNMVTSEIVEEIPFSGSGDYEGIAVKGETAYVVESNGTIYEVRDFLAQPQVTKYSTPLKSKNDIEGLYFDRAENRLLLALKDKKYIENGFRGVYAFDLAQKRFVEEPVYNLNFEPEALREGADGEAGMFPSELLKIEKSGELLILDAENLRLLVFSPDGKVKELYNLNKDNFPQPEGLTIDEEGKLYISNEGNPATIHLVVLK